jgi:hypothetical protein
MRTPTAHQAGPALSEQTQPGGSLGPRLALYRAHLLGRRNALILGLPGILAVLLPLIYGRHLYDRSIQYGPAAATRDSLPWYLLTLAALLVFAALLIYRLWLTRRFVAVHQRGLSVKLGRSRTLPWGHITGIAVGYSQDYILKKPLATRFRAWLVPGVGKPIMLDEHLEHLPELVTHLKAHLYPRLLPAIQADFQTGKWVHFGPVAIHTQSLRLQGEAIPWSDVKSLTIQGGDLVIDLVDSRPRHYPIWRIPNVELLLQLIQSGVS